MFSACWNVEIVCQQRAPFSRKNCTGFCAKAGEMCAVEFGCSLQMFFEWCYSTAKSIDQYRYFWGISANNDTIQQGWWNRLQKTGGKLSHLELHRFCRFSSKKIVNSCMHFCVRYRCRCIHMHVTLLWTKLNKNNSLMHFQEKLSNHRFVDWFKEKKIRQGKFNGWEARHSLSLGVTLELFSSANSQKSWVQITIFMQCYV